MEDGEAHYGINTGFGALARERVPREDLETLQRNLVFSHAVGVGDLIPKALSRLILHLKIHALGLGYSGVSRTTFDRLLLFAERDLAPAIPSRGSVGASGDLAPLAHLALPLLGEGQFWTEDGTDVRPAEAVLDYAGIALAELASISERRIYLLLEGHDGLPELRGALADCLKKT
jgi:histidine ammonia-lyase